MAKSKNRQGRPDESNNNNTNQNNNNNNNNTSMDCTEEEDDNEEKISSLVPADDLIQFRIPYYHPPILLDTPHMFHVSTDQQATYNQWVQWFTDINMNPNHRPDYYPVDMHDSETIYEHESWFNILSDRFALAPYCLNDLQFARDFQSLFHLLNLSKIPQILLTNCEPSYFNIQQLEDEKNQQEQLNIIREQVYQKLNFFCLFCLTDNIYTAEECSKCRCKNPRATFIERNLGLPDEGKALNLLRDYCVVYWAEHKPYADSGLLKSLLDYNDFYDVYELSKVQEEFNERDDFKCISEQYFEEKLKTFPIDRTSTRNGAKSAFTGSLEVFAGLPHDLLIIVAEYRPIYCLANIEHNILNSSFSLSGVATTFKMSNPVTEMNNILGQFQTILANQIKNVSNLISNPLKGKRRKQTDLIYQCCNPECGSRICDFCVEKAENDENYRHLIDGLIVQCCGNNAFCIKSGCIQQYAPRSCVSCVDLNQSNNNYHESLENYQSKMHCPHPKFSHKFGAEWSGRCSYSQCNAIHCIEHAEPEPLHIKRRKTINWDSDLVESEEKKYSEEELLKDIVGNWEIDEIHPNGGNCVQCKKFFCVDDLVHCEWAECAEYETEHAGTSLCIECAHKASGIENPKDIKCGLFADIRHCDLCETHFCYSCYSDQWQTEKNMICFARLNNKVVEQFLDEESDEENLYRDVMDETEENTVNNEPTILCWKCRNETDNDEEDLLDIECDDNSDRNSNNNTASNTLAIVNDQKL